MKIIAYIYTDPIIDTVIDQFFWGCEIDQVYTDVGIRKQQKKLLKECRQNPPNYLLVRSLSELGDNVTEIFNFIEKIELFDIQIIALEEDYTTRKFKHIKDTNFKKKLANLYQEIDTKIHSRNLQKSHSKNRLENLPPPGKAPFGYIRGKDSYIVNRANAPIVRAFFDRFLLYGSIADSVRYLEEKFNKKIPISTAIYWLKNPVYRGDLKYKNNEIISSTHTAIITREESAQIDRILKSHRLVKPRSASANYALAGLIKCQECRSSYRISEINNKKYQQKYLYLIPTNCEKKTHCKSLQYDIIFQEIITKICQNLPKITENFAKVNPLIMRENLEKEISKKEQILEQIAQLTIDHILDEETANLRKYKIAQEITQLKQEIAQLPPDRLNKISDALSNSQFWHDLSPSECRFYLREFIKVIEIAQYNQEDNHRKIIIKFNFLPEE